MIADWNVDLNRSMIATSLYIVILPSLLTLLSRQFESVVVLPNQPIV